MITQDKVFPWMGLKHSEPRSGGLGNCTFELSDEGDKTQEAMVSTSLVGAATRTPGATAAVCSKTETTSMLQNLQHQCSFILRMVFVCLRNGCSLNSRLSPPLGFHFWRSQSDKFIPPNHSFCGIARGSAAPQPTPCQEGKCFSRQ